MPASFGLPQNVLHAFAGDCDSIRNPARCEPCHRLRPRHCIHHIIRIRGQHGIHHVILETAEHRANKTPAAHAENALLRCCNRRADENFFLCRRPAVGFARVLEQLAQTDGQLVFRNRFDDAVGLAAQERTDLSIQWAASPSANIPAMLSALSAIESTAPSTVRGTESSIDSGLY